MLRLLMLQALSCIGRCSVTWSRDLMVLICSCGANHFLLYYFVLTLEESCIGPLIYSPTLSRWNVSKSDVWFFVLFYFVFVKKVFFLFWFSCSGFFYSSNPTPSVHTDSTYFIQFWMVLFRRPLSLSKNDSTKSIVPILYMWDV